MAGSSVHVSRCVHITQPFGTLTRSLFTAQHQTERESQSFLLLWFFIVGLSVLFTFFQCRFASHLSLFFNLLALVFCLARAIASHVSLGLLGESQRHTALTWGLTMLFSSRVLLITVVTMEFSVPLLFTRAIAMLLGSWPVLSSPTIAVPVLFGPEGLRVFSELAFVVQLGDLMPAQSSFPHLCHVRCFRQRFVMDPSSELIMIC